MLKPRLSAIIACPYPGPIIRRTALKGLPAVASATSASSFGALRLAVRAFLAPHFYFIFLGALDASFPHFPVVLYLRIRKLTVLSEYDVETQADDAESNEQQGCKKYLHIINKIPSEVNSPGGIYINFSS